MSGRTTASDNLILGPGQSNRRRTPAHQRSSHTGIGNINVSLSINGASVDCSHDRAANRRGGINGQSFAASDDVGSIGGGGAEFQLIESGGISDGATAGECDFTGVGVEGPAGEGPNAHCASGNRARAIKIADGQSIAAHRQGTTGNCRTGDRLIACHGDRVRVNHGPVVSTRIIRAFDTGRSESPSGPVVPVTSRRIIKTFGARLAGHEK